MSRVLLIVIPVAWKLKDDMHTPVCDVTRRDKQKSVKLVPLSQSLSLIDGSKQILLINIIEIKLQAI